MRRRQLQRGKWGRGGGIRAQRPQVWSPDGVLPTMRIVALDQLGALRPRRLRSEALLARFVVRYARALLGVTILATEYPIATDGGGRIDALGLDRDNRPALIEFKRVAHGTAICQGLFYLDWLDRHRDVVVDLALAKLGARAAGRIVWSYPRLLCVAEEIREREVAVARQIGPLVELVQIERLPRGLVLIRRHGAQLRT